MGCSTESPDAHSQRTLITPPRRHLTIMHHASSVTATGLCPHATSVVDTPYCNRASAPEGSTAKLVWRAPASRTASTSSGCANSVMVTDTRARYIRALGCSDSDRCKEEKRALAGALPSCARTPTEKPFENMCYATETRRCALGEHASPCENGTRPSHVHKCGITISA